MQLVYGQFLTWLDDQNDLDKTTGPASRLTNERLGRYILERCSQVSDNTLFNNLRMLAMMMRCLAPEQDWKWIARHPAGPRAAEAAIARKPPRIFDPGLLAHRIFASLTELETAAATVESARRRRDLLIVGVAMFTGPRVKTLSQIQIGRNLLRRPGGWEMCFEGDETKTEPTLIVRLPARLEPYFERYLEHDRPILLSASRVQTEAQTHALWVSQRGTALCGDVINPIFKAITNELYTLPLNPHCVRHTAATTLITHDPTAVSTAAAALGHEGVRSVDQHYDLTGTSVAQSVWFNLTKRYRGPTSDG
jgi:integrase